MDEIKYSVEEFGVILATPDSRVRLLDHSALPLIEAGKVDDVDLLDHRLTTLSYDPKQFHLKQPLITWLELTRKCNCSCLHCYIRGGEPRERELSTAQLFRILDELSAGNVFHLLLTGGEPLLHEDFLEILTYASNLRFSSISLVTNGTLLTEEVIAQFPRQHFAVGVSLDGIQTLNRFRGKQADYTEIQRNILLLRDYGLSVGVMCTVTKLNIHEIPAIFEWCRQNGVPATEFTCVVTGRILENPWLLPGLEDAEADAEICDQGKAYRIATLTSKEGEPYSSVHFSNLMKSMYLLNFLTQRCKGGRGTAYITSEGDVYPCTNCASMEMYPQGNVLHTPFAEIWNRGFGEFREEVTYEKFTHCQDCPINEEGWICSGKCPVLSANIHGDPYVCGYTEFQKETVRRRGQIYTRYGNR